MSMSRRSFVGLLSALGCSPWLSNHAVAGAAVEYTVIDLGRLGGSSYTLPLGLNDTGQVVGKAFGPGPTTHAFLWKDGEMRALETLGGEQSCATAINNRGEVVGWTVTATNERHAFLYKDGRIHDLGIPGKYSEATDINDRGEIVGNFQLPADGMRAFLWAQGTMHDLGVQCVEGPAINNASQVTGADGSWSLDGIHAFLWENGQLHDLGVPPAFHNSFATDINDQGQIVGFVHDGQRYGKEDLFFYDHGRWQLLGYPGIDPADYSLHINNANVVTISSPNSSSAVLLYQDGQLRELNTLLP